MFLFLFRLLRLIETFRLDAAIQIDYLCVLPLPQQWVFLRGVCVMLIILRDQLVLSCLTNLFHHSLLAPTWTAFSDYS